ncbi:21360_t:CDS:1, partial [Rhizophagus irregularis]
SISTVPTLRQKKWETTRNKNENQHGVHRERDKRSIEKVADKNYHHHELFPRVLTSIVSLIASKIKIELLVPALNIFHIIRT